MQPNKLLVLILSLFPISLYAQQQPAQLDISVENHHYFWKSQDGLKGKQHVMPINLTYQKGTFNVGLRRAYILSKNQSPEQYGRVAHWSDTSLSLAYTAFQDKNYPLRFNLSANIPNGKATLSGDEKNAIMDGHLVWQTRLGEGLNITPGINIAHSFSDKDTMGFGISRIFRGEFDPNGDVENDKINPGDDTIIALQYSRTGKRGQIQAGLSHQHSGITKRNKQSYYQKGNLWTSDISGQFALTPYQSIYGGYSYAYRKKDKYINNQTGGLEQEAFNSNGSSHALNLGYSLNFKQRHNIGAAADYLKIKSNGYDPINALYIPARTKTGIGINYQYQITPKSQIAVSAKRFWMKDGSTPYLDKQNYRGWNLFSSIKYQF
ncbi:hypothetical protein [Conchiformibius kuhniae]|uniref:Porin n=1 Tax=Conchiformibius kuhniae TaxID=211502 RepID=A0A8T9MQQ8_9NEIS|nr:hypothetical protein [Conchiformibius kuhniae]